MLTPPTGAGGAFNIPFNIVDEKWKTAATLDSLYFQAIMQYLIMSMISYMIDTTMLPLSDGEQLERRHVCLGSVAIGMSGLTDPKRAGPADPNTPVGPPSGSLETYYGNIAKILTDLAGGRVSVVYRAQPTSALLFSTMTMNSGLQTWSESATVTTGSIQAVDHDMFIINASIVCAIMDFIRDEKSTMITQLPALVKAYEVNRGLQPAKVTTTPQPQLTQADYCDRIMGGDNTTTRADVVYSPNAVVHVVGDLDGNLQIIYDFLISKGFLLTVPGSTALTWTKDTNIYVVQCGDQIDQRRRDDARTSFDVEVLVFMDYLQKISNNHVLSIIGNHEWMNVMSDFRYVHATNAKQTQSEERDWRAAHLSDRDISYRPFLGRIELFKYDGLVGRMLRHRNILLRINDAVFSHGGVPQRAVKGVKDAKELDQRIADLNQTVEDRGNWVKTLAVTDPYSNSDAHNPTGMFQNLVYDQFGILWTTEFSLKANNPSIGDTPMLPSELKSSGVRFMVTGHNKIPEIEVVSRSGASDSSAIKARSTTSVQTQGMLEAVIGTDVILPPLIPFPKMQYLVMTSVASKFVSLNIFNFDCTGTVCDRKPNPVFTALLEKIRTCQGIGSPLVPRT